MQKHVEVKTTHLNNRFYVCSLWFRLSAEYINLAVSRICRLDVTTESFIFFTCDVFVKLKWTSESSLARRARSTCSSQRDLLTPARCNRQVTSARRRSSYDRMKPGWAPAVLWVSTSASRQRGGLILSLPGRQNGGPGAPRGPRGEQPWHGYPRGGTPELLGAAANRRCS